MKKLAFVQIFLLVLLTGCLGDQLTEEKRLCITNLSLASEIEEVKESVNKYVLSGQAVDDAIRADQKYRIFQEIFSEIDWRKLSGGEFELEATVVIPNKLVPLYREFTNEIALKIDYHRRKVSNNE